MLNTVQETAKFLKVSPSHVRRMIASGQFPYYKVGHKLIRLDPEEIRSAVRLQRGETKN